MSEHQKTTQAIISDREEFVENKTIEKFALFTEDGRSLMSIITDFESRIDAIENP